MDLERFLKGLTNLILAVVMTLLGLRFVLRLFGANASNEFVEWVYSASSEIMGPFRNIFPSQNLDGFVIEFSTLFAMLVYGIIGMLAFYLINLLTPDRDVAVVRDADEDEVVTTRRTRRR